MKPFDFCPSCAARLIHDGDGMSCPACGRRWFRNPAPAVGAAIVSGGKVLVTQRGVEPHKGRFDIPGGFLDVGEHPVAALKRELQEELGIEIETDVRDCVSMVPHVYGDDGEYVLALGFLARWVGGEPRPGDDVADFRWVTPAELDRLPFAWEHDRETARMALHRDREGSA